MVHWILVVVLLGAAASGILLWKKELQPYVAFLFQAGKVGVIHISLSVALVGIILLHLWYLRHKNFFNHITIQSLRANGRVRWRYVNVLLYWVLFTIILLETITRVLLTKLVNQDVLASIFMIEKRPLLLAHLYLILPILVFPIAHVIVHWLDGQHRRLLSIFRPQVFPRCLSQGDIVQMLRRENASLRKNNRDAASGR